MKPGIVHLIALAVIAGGLLYALYLYNRGELHIPFLSEGFQAVEQEQSDDEQPVEESAEGFEDAEKKEEKHEEQKATAESFVSRRLTEEGFMSGYSKSDPYATQYASASDLAASGSSAPSNDVANCYTRDGLNPQDLLPKPSAEASQFLSSNPSTGGSPEQRNLLDAGFHFGIDTVAQTNKNPNYQLRSEPPIARCHVIPFNASTIGPDPAARLTLEIGSQVNPNIGSNSAF
jgi:hypothetical protein